ncbi:MAG: insulinase family protein [Hyphomicrobiaceae bacterium]|nr:insulinase family protein [Hyphomicrobiaceae bacterium]
MMQVSFARASRLAGGWRKAAAAVASIFLIQASGTSPASAMNIQTIKSPGGIEAWLVEEHSVPLMALRFSFEGGSSQDMPNKDGTANFITAMMDEGAGDIKSAEFQERMEEIAMRMSWSDSKDALYGGLETLTQNREKATELLKLAVTKPRFDADAVDRIRGQLIANLMYADKDPDKVAGKAWFSTAFEGHPYARSSEGTPQTVGGMTSEDLHAFHKRLFAKDNLRVVAVGDIDATTLGKMIDEIFGDLPAKAELNPVSQTQPVNTGTQTIIDMNVPQSVAVFGLPAMARKDPDFIPAFVVNHILGGGGFASKLMEEVREKRGLAYSVYSYLQPFDHTSVMVGSVATKNESMAESLDIIRKELTKMAENGPAPDDLEAAKSFLIGSYPLRFDTDAKIAAQLLGLMEEGFGPDYVENRNKLIDGVTMEDAKRVAKRLLQTDKLIVTIVGKPANVKAIGAVTAAPPRG